MPHRKSKVRGERQLEALASRPSNWRIFNVGQHLSRVRETSADNDVRLFSRRRMNDSIVIKHALRPNEFDLFERPPVVATKIVVPVDPQQISLGAYSFFVGERSAAQTMQRLFGIVSERGRRDPDMEILGLLDRSPSLDVFLLKEILGGATGVSEQVFDVSLADVPEFRSYIHRELTPLVALATGSADPAKVGRLVDSIFGAKLGSQAENFLEALSLPAQKWPEVTFAWKAALYYEHNAADLRRRFETFAAAMRLLQTYGHSEAFPRSAVAQQHRALARAAGASFARCQQGLAHFNSARRSAIIAAGNVAGLGTYLGELTEAVFDYAANAALTDHILSYWRYGTAGFNVERMPAEVFFNLAANLCATAEQYRQPNQVLTAA